MTDQPTFRLTFSCPDQPGIVAKVSGFLFDQGANIISSQQHKDSDRNQFFMRVVFGFETEESISTGFQEKLANLAKVLIARRNASC